MSLKWLEARKFRNLSHISVDLDPGLNLFLVGMGVVRLVSLNQAICYLPRDLFVVRVLIQ